MIRIDGSFGEGGGQILRTALALSCVTGKSFEIYNIRRGRKRPGLGPQHLTCVKAAKVISNADVAGAEPGSQMFRFSPREVTGGDYQFDVAEIKGSAGSVTLVLQALLLPLSLAKKGSVVTVCGGTHVEWSPTFHYLKDVLLPTLAKVGIHTAIDIKKWGWYPKGGGSVRLSVTPAGRISPVEIVERGKLIRLSGVSALSNLPLSIAERQKGHAEYLLKNIGLRADIEVTNADSTGKGTLLFILA